MAESVNTGSGFAVRGPCREPVVSASPAPAKCTDRAGCRSNLRAYPRNPLRAGRFRSRRALAAFAIARLIGAGLIKRWAALRHNEALRILLIR